MEFVDPRRSPFVEPNSRDELPHLYKPGGHYFVTFRLYDAVLTRPYVEHNAWSPAPKVDPFELAQRYDPPITLGACALASPDIAEIVQQAIRAGHGERYDLSAWCIMPNHVHAVFTPLVETNLSGILQSWKGATSRRINQLLKRSGTFWERESFDHLIRTAASYEQFVGYTEENPVKAGLCQRPEDWPFGSAFFRKRHDYGELSAAK